MYSLAENRFPKWHFKRGNHETVSSERGRERVNRCQSDKGWQDSLLRAAPHSQPAVPGFVQLPIPPKGASTARHRMMGLEYSEV